MVTKHRLSIPFISGKRKIGNGVRVFRQHKSNLAVSLSASSSANSVTIDDAGLNLPPLDLRWVDRAFVSHYFYSLAFDSAVTFNLPIRCLETSILCTYPWLKVGIFDCSSSSSRVLGIILGRLETKVVHGLWKVDLKP